ncbi:MAG: hypothetical protein K0S86_1075 [Geminicoccaceae bacterium]|nr:hypothetical protein [Geminicoccaceae bacterium]
MKRVALVALLLVGPGSVLAQERTIPEKLAAPARATLQRLIDSAGVAGLPVDPLYSKAQEGVFRGADDARVIAAVQRLARDMGDARTALGERVTAEEIAAAANALRAGIATTDLVRLRDTRAKGANADHRLTVALVVLADLAMRGVPPSLAAASVNELVARNVPDGTLISFRQTVERDLVNGRSPASALDARTRSIVDDVERRRP